MKNKETGKEWKGTEFLTTAITFPNQVCLVWPARTIYEGVLIFLSVNTVRGELASGHCPWEARFLWFLEQTWSPPSGKSVPPRVTRTRRATSTSKRSPLEKVLSLDTNDKWGNSVRIGRGRPKRCGVLSSTPPPMRRQEHPPSAAKSELSPHTAMYPRGTALSDSANKHIGRPAQSVFQISTESFLV